MNDIAYDRVQGYLDRLKLTSIADQLDPLAEQAAKEEWTYLEFLDRLLDAEVSARYARDVAMKTNLAHFPFQKSFDEFDFAFQPTIHEGFWEQKDENPKTIISTRAVYQMGLKSGSGTLELGDHAIADQLRELEISTAAFVTRHYLTRCGILPAGEVVGPADHPYTGHIGEDLEYGRLTINYDNAS